MIPSQKQEILSMNKRIKLTIGIGLTVLLLVAVFTTAAFAQGPGGAFGGMMGGSEEAVPQTRLPSAVETTGHGLPGTVTLRQVPSGRPGAQDSTE
jgi:hypothetical protein